MDETIVKSTEQDDSWVGPKTMTHQLYVFADTYFNAIGKNQTYTYAAKKVLGADDKRAPIKGSEWAKYTVVQNYWKALEEAYGFKRKAIHMRSLQRLEEIAEKVFNNEEVKNFDQIITIEDLITSKTQVIMDYEYVKKDKQDKLSGVTDESTRNTMNEIMLSIKATVGGNDD